MRLTAYTNYALRTLQLAALRSPDLVRVEDVVRLHRLKKPNIVKAVHELGKQGYLETQRGRGGGFRLAQPATIIRVGDIVRVMEGDLDMVECFKPDTNTCPLIGVCRLSRAFHEATRAFMEVLDNVTIADIASNRSDLLERITMAENQEGTR